MRIPNSPGSVEAIGAQTKAEMALNLRTSGVPFREIAAKLGYADESGARKAVYAILKKSRDEKVADYRAIELEKLDKLEFAISQSARSGHLGAIDRMLRIMERRARLLGLDTPEKQALVGERGGPIVIRVVEEDKKRG